MAQALATIRALATALGLCDTCEAKLTGDAQNADSPQKNDQTRHKNLSSPADSFSTTSPRPTNDVSYQHSTLTDVRIVDCDLQAFTLKQCSLENVTFKHCDFSNVVFDSLRLRNVTFLRVDFRNLVLRDVAAWDDVLWRNAAVANAVVDGSCFVKVANQKLVLPLLTREMSGLSRTTYATVSAGGVNVVPDRWLKPVEVAERGAIGLLQLPESVLDNVMRYLFPRSRSRYANTIMMSDMPTSSLKTSTDQTTYSHRSPFGYRSAQFTYHGWPYPLAKSNPDPHRDAFRLNFCTALLLVSKDMYNLAIGYIYDRCFYFDRPERCLAFLHDHQASEHGMLSIVLQYSSQTDPAAWRRLFDILVDGKELINELTLELSSEIWNSTPWKRQDRAESFLSWQGWANMWQVTDPKDKEQTFLQHVARIPGSRLNVGRRIAKAEDVRFFLRIQGSKGFPSREALCDDLQLLMRQKMLQQGEGSVKVKRECCGMKQLEKSCYWS